jgi:dinuclear metal center YbgI/SA1388 family protein
MTIKEVIKYLEDWAPTAVAWQKDNVGLQVGNQSRRVKNILLVLELTPDVVKQAVKQNCNLIITHHPFIFHPIKKLDLERNADSKLIEILIKHDISLYSAHTNLDFTKHGVSFQLAKIIRLTQIDFLKNLNANQVKLSVFVPHANVEKVASAIFDSGGGIIGEYSNCSFQTNGEGTFKGSSLSNPAIGKKGKHEKVNEVKLEVLIDSWKMKNVLAAMINAHPYEEPAYDVYPLENANVNFGMGAIGNFNTELSTPAFLELIAKKLRTKNLRYSKARGKKIRRVAVCGGSGSELVDEAINKNADALVTADIKYHTFHYAMGKIMLVDAGHYETEIPIITELQKRLKKFVSEKSNNKVFRYKGITNPINFYN